MGHKKGKLVTQPIMWPFLLKDLDSCQNKASHITPFMRLETFSMPTALILKRNGTSLFLSSGVSRVIFL